MSDDRIASALMLVLESSNVMDSNGESANVVDAIAALTTGLMAIAKAIEQHSESVDDLGRMLQDKEF